ncbi:hypothetical protein PIB30_017399 [Stylosanthes scabra]|uniref:Uncharacterized protein n=1 Tax=Stylosanthes scabra TaxID=79078 RepID=A0ABU6V7J3_9FABA|nr:hypothetical protein [Stylosanthes scabra]
MRTQQRSHAYVSRRGGHAQKADPAQMRTHMKLACTPPLYLHRLRVHSSNADLLESIMGSVPHSWYAKDMQRFLLGGSSSDLGHSSDYRDA